MDIGTAFGWDQGISTIITNYYFLGNINNFSIDDFTGKRFNASVGASFVIEIGMGVSISRVDGGVIVGISNHIGVSPPGPSGNFNFGRTWLRK